MDKVTIFMSTYNGEKYLREQLDSLLAQVNVKCRILIRDDGSTDGTKNILSEYAEKHKNIKWIAGKNIGVAKSFWMLVRKSYGADYYAFCDQDDVWLPEKLSIAISKINKEKPTLYFSKTIMVDKDGNKIKTADYEYQSRKPSFPQLIVENIATGCTMVWNNRLHEIAGGINPKNIRMHDHLLYLICEFCGGKTVYDTDSYILYRQHENNVIGGGIFLKKYIGSIKKYLFNDSKLVLQAMELLNVDEKYIDESKRKMLEPFVKYKVDSTFINRIELILNGTYKQKSFIKNIMIDGLILMNRL